VQTVLPQSDEATADELARARAALERRGPARAPLEPARKRAFEFLVRRGYSTTVAYRTVREWSAGPTD
jgi:SOS response regulatory protein OraA/RecX